MKLLLAILGGIALSMLMPSLAFADNCSSLSDCFRSAGAAAASAIAAAAAAIAWALGLGPKPDMQSIAQGVNPSNSGINCGHIVDAVIDRLNGSNPNATAPDAMNGSESDIENRHDTRIDWIGMTFDDAFRGAAAGGDGTTQIIGIEYATSGSSHVVVMHNRQGQVGIIEGQGGGEVITTPARAEQVYGADSKIGIGILR